MDNMKIKWLRDIELNVIDYIDEDTNTPVESSETINAGDIDDVDIIKDAGDCIDLQFGDGSMALSVMKKWYEVVKDK